jgi:NAD(P)-dependent dehydrogenase (short-subunit alcohol dehydrogenase family)
MLAVEVTRRWSGDGIFANALNPGTIATGLQKYTGGLKTPVDHRKSVEQDAATSVFLAASLLTDGIGGRYFEDVSKADTKPRLVRDRRRRLCPRAPVCRAPLGGVHRMGRSRHSTGNMT